MMRGSGFREGVRIYRRVRSSFVAVVASCTPARRYAASLPSSALTYPVYNLPSGKSMFSALVKVHQPRLQLLPTS